MAGKKVVTGEARMSYLNWAMARVNNISGEEQYSVMLLIPKSDTGTINAINAAVMVAVQEKWGSNPPKNLKHPLRDGDAERDGAEYVDHYFLNCKSKRMPDTVGPDLQPIIDEKDFRSGDYGRASLNAFAYDVNGNRGVSFGLNGLQKTRDGEPLGGASRASEDFGDGFKAQAASAPADFEKDDIFA